jgi:tRNA1(Val) A37 N6-methylase TrmN6
MTITIPEITEGSLLGRRVRHDQMRDGHRTGIEPVLLAASIPAHPGDRVMEGGTGSGAALLCLAERVPGLTGVGIERDPAVAALAAHNLMANGFGTLSILTGDLTELRPEGTFDHAFANPPWHEPSGTTSPDAGREAAKRASPGIFASWTRALAAPLRHHGTLTLVVAAAALPACLDALTGAGCGSPALMPLWPKSGRAAKLLLLRGVKGGRGLCRVLPGLVLHAPDGAYTAEATTILREGAALEL